MSLLGIQINPALKGDRAKSAYGFADDGNDERLLELIGAIKETGGQKTLKYNKGEIAGLLNWIADGKNPEELPDLAKRLLCLTREKLRRGTIDAGTANKTRNQENMLIAEIDGILKNPKTTVECVVDIEKEKCKEKPIVTETDAAPIVATRAAEMQLTNASKKPVQPSGSPSVGVTGDSSSPTKSLVNILPQTSSPAAQPAAPESALCPDEKFNPVVDKISTILTGTKESVLIRHCVAVLAHLFKFRKELANCDALLTVLNTEDIGENEKILKIMNSLNIDPIAPEASTFLPKVEEVAAAVVKAIGPRRYRCSEKVGCFQQLVYATCGGASLLDPLVDHLDKLVATMNTLPEPSPKTAAIERLIRELRGYIETKQIELKYPLTDENIIGTVTDDEILRNIENKYAKLAMENTTRITMLSDLNDPKMQKMQLLEELEEEMKLLLDLEQILDTSDEGDIAIYDKIREFKTNINAAISLLQSTSKIQSNIREGCGVRASYYRAQLAIAKQQEANSCDEKVKKCEGELTQVKAQKDAIETDLRRQCEEREAVLNAQITELNGAIAEEKRRCSALVNGINAELVQSKELEKTSSAAKNAALSGKVELEARITALEQQLRQRANTTESEQAREIARLTGELAAARQQKQANNAKSSLADAKAEVLQQRLAELEGQLEKCNEQLASRANNSSTKAELRAVKEEALREKTRIEAELAAVRQESAAKNATITELNVRIAECEESSAAIRTELDAVQTQLVAAGNTRGELEAARQQLAAAQVRIAELEAQLSALRAECGENDDLRRQITRLTEALAAEKARCDSLAAAAAAAPDHTFKIGPRMRGNLPSGNALTGKPVAQRYIDATRAGKTVVAAKGETGSYGGGSRRQRQRSSSADKKSSHDTRKNRK